MPRVKVGPAPPDASTLDVRPQAIKAAGATLIYLPKYSPDLNPIEPAFSKLKAHLRKAQERTIDTLWARKTSYSITSNRANAPTSSSTQATLEPDRIPL